MNTLEKIKTDETNSQAVAVTDLPVTAEQADRITGGTKFDSQGRLLIGTEGGLF